jgi:hypothetical protein
VRVTSSGGGGEVELNTVREMRRKDAVWGGLADSDRWVDDWEEAYDTDDNEEPTRMASDGNLYTRQEFIDFYGVDVFIHLIALFISWAARLRLDTCHPSL